MCDLVSIITVCLNSEKTIKRTIESVLNQTYKNLQYIIIDGLSSDNTLEIAKSYEKKFMQIGMQYEIISEKDNGIYDAMNKGIKLSKGELVGIINSDDWYETIAVEKAIQTYNHENYDLFYADLRIINGKNSLIKKAKNSKWITSRYWNHPTTFIPRRVYQKYQYRNDTIHDDWDLILRLRKNNCKISVINEVLANFSRDGISHEKSIKKAFKRANIKYKIYRDNGYGGWYFIECCGMEILKLVL